MVHQLPKAPAGAPQGETQDADEAPTGLAPRLALLFHHPEGNDLASLAGGRPLVVGRAPPADLVLPDPRLSRAHARFIELEGAVEVEDLGSRNGILLHGARIQRARVGAGAELLLGATVARVVRVGGEAAARTAPAAAPDAGLVGGARMAELLELADKVAASRIPVLLRGESGTGKEVLARRIHERGRRRAHPLVAVNCAAIPAQLVESTLFGHERGAFTGALAQRRGLFEEADGGTLFLDEIAELPPAAQAALLRVLETGTFPRVGSVREIRVDVRVVAATHRDLLAMAREGRFREDLCYRLDAVTLEVPPLRERPDDVAPLARHFLRLANEADGRAVSGIADDALAALVRYAWPGNVRELRNAIDRAVVVTRSPRIEVADLPPAVRGGASRPEAPASDPAARSEDRGGGGLRAAMRAYEAQRIVQALRDAGGRRKVAAKKLGMPVRSLSHKIKALGIRVVGDEDDDDA